MNLVQEFTFTGTLNPPLPIGAGPIGTRMYYEVTGGEITGDRLNGNVLASGGGNNFGSGFEEPFLSDDPSHCMTGPNTLEVEVDNAVGPDPNPVGLVVRGAVRYAPGPPTVPSLSPIGLAALLLLGLTVTWQCVGRVKLRGPAASR